MKTNFLKGNDYLIITSPVLESSNQLKALKSNAIVSIKPTNDELTYFNDIKTILNELRNYHKAYTVRIYLKNRELFRQYKLINIIPRNVNLIICANDYEYTAQEYLTEEEKLERLVRPIRESSLSPLEKFLAVYDIVKKFKPYKDYKNSGDDSRNLKYILDDDNEYIVCVGFANLLKELLNRVGIPNMCIHTSVDESYDEGYTQDEINLSLSGHTRNLIRIDDDKYDIHGYYLADTTWDNHPQYDLYTNCLLTFDRKKEAKRLESLEDVDLLLDFHNVEEFIKKIKFYIKRKTNLKNIDAQTEEKLRTKCYKDLYLKIMHMLATLDKREYQILFNKYEQLLNIDIAKTNSYLLEKPLIDFLTDYAKYIIPLSNNEVELETILRAAIEVKKKINKWSISEIKTWLKKTMEDNQKVANIAFPYVYDPRAETEAYLKERNSKK